VVDFAITVPITTAEKRIRLQNKENRKQQEKYKLATGPYKNIAKLGIVTKREWARFGHRPPASFMPKGEFNPLAET
jgi:hypothetical protein